jgi:hypothetical protein
MTLYGRADRRGAQVEPSRQQHQRKVVDGNGKTQRDYQRPAELAKAQGEVRRLDAALAALGNLTGRSPAGKRRTLSTAARRKISLAQKARWAKRSSTSQTGTGRPKSAECRQQPVEKSQPLSGQGGEGESWQKVILDLKGPLLLLRWVVRVCAKRAGAPALR